MSHTRLAVVPSYLRGKTEDWKGSFGGLGARVERAHVLPASDNVASSNPIRGHHGPCPGLFGGLRDTHVGQARVT